MPLKILNTEFKGHKITVRSTWNSGASLLIDDKIVDKSEAENALDESMSFLSYILEVDGEIFLIEVFAKVVFNVKLKICVNKKWIYGDKF